MASTIRRAAAIVTSLVGRTQKPRYQSLATGQDELEDGQRTPTKFIRKTPRRRNVRRDIFLFTLSVVGVIVITYQVIR